MTHEEIQKLNNYELQNKLNEILLKNEDFTKATRGAYYIEDMYSMQLAESLMTADQWTKYIMNIVAEQDDMSIEQYDTIREYCSPEEAVFIRGAWHGITATPRQRAKALLWVLTEAES